MHKSTTNTSTNFVTHRAFSVIFNTVAVLAILFIGSIVSINAQTPISGYAPTDFIVADTAMNRIAVYDSSFSFKGYLDDNIEGVTGLDLLPNGNLVAVTQYGIVKQYAPDSSVVSNFSTKGTGSPFDVKAGANNVLYLGARGQEGEGVPSFNSSGEWNNRFGTSNYSGVAILPNGILWAAQTHNGQIDVYDTTTLNNTGTIMLDQASGGEQSGTSTMFYNQPTNTVFMSSRWMGTIFERDLNGTVVRTYQIGGIPRNMGGPTFDGITVGANGDVYGTFAGSSTVYHWNSNAVYLDSTAISNDVAGASNILYVKAPPCTTTAIVSQPADAIKTVGDSVTFAVGTEGTNLTYQWRKGGVDIQGANTSSLVIDSVATTDAGSYSVFVSGDCGNATSNAAMLTVNKIDTNVYVSSSMNPSAAGHDVIFTASVESSQVVKKTDNRKSSKNATYGPTGTVQFFIGGNAIASCESVMLVGGEAQCTVGSLTEGTYVITAQYSGDARFNSNNGTLCGGQVVTNIIEWQGAMSTDWNDAANWMPGVVPTASNNVMIPQGVMANEPLVSNADFSVGSVTVDTGRTLTIDSLRVLSIYGTLVNHGTIDVAGVLNASNVYSDGLINYTGSEPQTISGGTYTDMTINALSGAQLADDVTITGTLSLNGGIVTTGDKLLIVDVFGVVNGGSSESYVTGSVRKMLVGDAGRNVVNGQLSFVFPVGTENGYSPVELTNIIPGNGSFTVIANQGGYEGQPSGLPTRVLNRWWNLTNDGGVIAADVTFHYLAGDITGGTESNYRVYKIENGTAVSQTAQLDTVANTATVAGVTSFSDWTMAELVPTSAQVDVGGRVMNDSFVGIPNAVVTLTSSTGDVRVSRTNPFGYYKLEGVDVGETYTVTIENKVYQFSPQVIIVLDEMTELNFMGTLK